MGTLIIKIVSKRVDYQRFPITNFLYSVVEINCSKCHKRLFNNSYAYMCSDMDKIWHEECFQSNHPKRNWDSSVKAHGDKLVFFKVIPKDAFDIIPNPEVELKC